MWWEKRRSGGKDKDESYRFFIDTVGNVVNFLKLLQKVDA